MSDDTMASSLVQTWVPVLDSQGRTRLEARWTDATSASTGITHAA